MQDILLTEPKTVTYSVNRVLCESHVGLYSHRSSLLDCHGYVVCVCVCGGWGGESEILYPLIIIYFVKNHIVLKNSGYLISNPNMVFNEEKIVCKFGISSSRKNWWEVVERGRSALLWEPR